MTSTPSSSRREVKLSGEVPNVVTVDEEMRRLGRLALDRMLALA